MGNRAGADIKNRFHAVWNKRQQDIRTRRRESNKSRKNDDTAPPPAPAGDGNEEDPPKDGGELIGIDDGNNPEGECREKFDAQGQREFSIKNFLV
jgi:hypothetical protein